MAKLFSFSDRLAQRTLSPTGERVWVRPSCIPWLHFQNKSKFFFPDFTLFKGTPCKKPFDTWWIG